MSCALDISPLAVQSPTVRTPPASRVRPRPAAATKSGRDRKRQKLALQEELARLDDEEEEDIDDDTGREAADDELELADLPPDDFPANGVFTWTENDPTHPVQAPFTHTM